MDAADYLIEAYFLAVGAVEVAVAHDGVAFGLVERKGVADFMGAAVRADHTADGVWHGDVFTPAVVVVGVAFPMGGLVGGAVDFNEGHGAAGLDAPVDPFHIEAGQRDDGGEALRVRVGKQVAHLSAVGHAAEHGVGTVQLIFTLELALKGQDEGHVVDFPAFLRRVADVPAGLALAGVLEPLGVAEHEAVPPGAVDHCLEVALGLAAVAVADEDQRALGTKGIGYIEPVFTFLALVAHSVTLRLGAEGSGSNQQHRRYECELFHLSVIFQVFPLLSGGSGSSALLGP